MQLYAMSNTRKRHVKHRRSMIAFGVSLAITALTIRYRLTAVPATESSTLLFLHNEQNKPKPLTTSSSSIQAPPRITYRQTGPNHRPYMFYHLHTPKAGGTTFNHWLYEVVSPHIGGWCAMPDCCEHPTEDVYKILDADGHPYVCGIYHKEGDYSTVAELQTYFKVPLLGLTLLRDPLASQVSAIAQEARATQRDMSLKIAKFASGECSGPGRNKEELCGGYQLYNRQTARFGSTLEEAQAALDSLFYVGITDFMLASQCLFTYQVGIFNTTACNITDCSISNLESSLKGSVERHTHDKPLFSVGDGDEQFFERFTYQDFSTLQLLLRKDLLLYSYALQQFHQRVRYVEQEMGVTLICTAI